MAVRAAGPSKPPVWYLFDAEQKKASVLGASYPELSDVALGARTAFDFKARDGRVIEAFLTLPASTASTARQRLPLVVLPHGGPHAHDAVDFDYWAHGFASRGFAVVQPNFRGSTGYGGGHWSEGFGEWGGAMQDDLADAARHLINTGVAEPSQVAIAGWSYGGYAALMGLIKEPGFFKCGVAGAAVTDLRQLLQEGIEYSKFALLKETLGTHSKEAFDRLSAQRRAGEIKAPVLVVHGTSDRVVNIDQSEAFVRSARNAGADVEAIWFEGGGHHLVAQENRIAWLERVSAFLKTRCGEQGAVP